MKIQKIMLIITLILFGFLIIGNAAAAMDNNSTKTSLIAPTTANSAVLSNINSDPASNSKIVDPYEHPDIDGNMVVYEKKTYINVNSIPTLNSSEIYWKNITSNTGGRVSTYYGSLQDHPSISGTRVVWQDNREGPWVIYWKNIITGNGGRVSTYTEPT